MKAERLTALLDCLLHEGRKTAEDLALRYEVSIRTIYRDIDALCMAGVPIVAVPGAGGGYEIEASYRINRSFLSRDELTDLIAVLKGFSRVMQDKSLDRSLSKLKALGRKSPAPVLPPPLITELSPWGGVQPDQHNLTLIRCAITEHRLITFYYTDNKGNETERSVEPFSLVYGSLNWYLHAWCRLRKSFRLFKLKRIHKLTLQIEFFDPLIRMPVPDPFAMDTGEPCTEIVIVAAMRMKNILEEKLYWVHPEQTADKQLVYRFKYPLGPYLKSLLFSCGPGLFIEKPLSLRMCIVRAAEEMLRINKI